MNETVALVVGAGEGRRFGGELLLDFAHFGKAEDPTNSSGIDRVFRRKHYGYEERARRDSSNSSSFQ